MITFYIAFIRAQVGWIVFRRLCFPTSKTIQCIVTIYSLLAWKLCNPQSKEPLEFDWSVGIFGRKVLRPLGSFEGCRRDDEGVCVCARSRKWWQSARRKPMTTTFVRKRHIQRETCVFWNKETRSEPGTYRVLLHRERSELNNYWTPLSDRNQRDEDFQIKKRLPQVWVDCRLTDKTSSKAKPNRHITGHSERRMSGFRHRPRHVRSSTRSCKARGRVANSVGVWGRSGSG